MGETTATMEPASSLSPAAPTTRLNFSRRVNGDQATRLTAMSEERVTALDQTPPRLALSRGVVPIEVLPRPGLEENRSGRVVYLDPALFHWFAAAAAVHVLPFEGFVSSGIRS